MYILCQYHGLLLILLYKCIVIFNNNILFIVKLTLIRNFFFSVQGVQAILFLEICNYWNNLLIKTLTYIPRSYGIESNTHRSM